MKTESIASINKALARLNSQKNALLTQRAKTLQAELNEIESQITGNGVVRAAGVAKKSNGQHKSVFARGVLKAGILDVLTKQNTPLHVKAIFAELHKDAKFSKLTQANLTNGIFALAHSSAASVKQMGRGVFQAIKQEHITKKAVEKKQEVAVAPVVQTTPVVVPA